ncbi:MAG: cytochrome c [Chloroflexi bacterium]|nr:cytochrome c [Chloroflexota bacterium]
MKRITLLGLVLAFALAACSTPTAQTSTLSASGHGPGMGAGMMQRHSAPIPTAYSGLVNPIAADADSLARGATVYAAYCATCHGDGGMGDGPAGAALDPAPVPVAHTSQMMGDDYLFWRISEGGVAFQTAMLPWKGTLDEPARWDVINYVRALGTGQVAPERAVGGAAFDPQAEVALRTEALAQAVAQGVITRDEADTFTVVHAALDNHLAANQPAPGTGNPVERQTVMLAELVTAGTIAQAQADAFTDIHNRLHEAGLLP